MFYQNEKIKNIFSRRFALLGFLVGIYGGF
jgi:hypothetical protein